jgi:hypothetical protein
MRTYLIWLTTQMEFVATRISLTMPLSKFQDKLDDYYF